MLIPVVAIVIIILMIFEAVYQGAGFLIPEDKKIDIDMLRTLLPQMIRMLNL